MGSLPDARVLNASVEDWQAVLDLVAEKGRAGSGCGTCPGQCEVGLVRPASIAAGGFPPTASRTRRARFRAPGSPQVPFDSALGVLIP